MNTPPIPVGIIAREESEFPPFGKQTFFFQEMVEASRDLPTQVFVFSPMRWDGTQMIEAFQYLDGKWVISRTVIPDVIYDRFTAKAPGEEKTYLRFRAFLQGLHCRFTTPVQLVELVRNKVAFHTFLREHGIPTLEAILLGQLMQTDLDRFFQYDDTIYVKPVIGSNGANIATVTLSANRRCLIRKAGGREEAPAAGLLAYLKASFPGDSYFVQPRAKVIDYGGRAYDIRVLVQNHGQCDYQVTGLGVRFGAPGSWVSNISAGGSALPFSTLKEHLARAGLDAGALEEAIKFACLQCTRLLDGLYGGFAEMAYDILPTSDRGAIFLEANTKPARWIFTVMADALQGVPAEASYYQQMRMLSVRLPLVFVATALSQY